MNALLIGTQPETLAQDLDYCLFEEGLIWDLAGFALNFADVNQTNLLSCIQNFDNQFDSSNFDALWYAIVTFLNSDARCDQSDVFWIDEGDVNDCSDPEMLIFYGNYTACSDAENLFTSFLNDFYSILDILGQVENFMEDLMNFYPELESELSGLSQEEIDSLNDIYQDIVETSCWCMSYDEGCYISQDLNLTTSEAEEFDQATMDNDPAYQACVTSGQRRNLESSTRLADSDISKDLKQKLKKADYENINKKYEKINNVPIFLRGK